MHKQSFLNLSETKWPPRDKGKSILMELYQRVNGCADIWKRNLILWFIALIVFIWNVVHFRVIEVMAILVS